MHMRGDHAHIVLCSLLRSCARIRVPAGMRRLKYQSLWVGMWVKGTRCVLWRIVVAELGIAFTIVQGTPMIMPLASAQCNIGLGALPSTYGCCGKNTVYFLLWGMVIGNVVHKLWQWACARRRSGGPSQNLCTPSLAMSNTAKG